MLFHTAAAVVGLVGARAVLGDRVRGAALRGAAYLLWMAVARAARRPRRAAPSAADAAPAPRIVRQAVVTNVLNPKIIVFYVAFLPQFLDRDAARSACSCCSSG